jgi:hypothetical protein
MEPGERKTMPTRADVERSKRVASSRFGACERIEPASRPSIGDAERSERMSSATRRVRERS